MVTIVVTGGVACGKSSFARRFMSWIPEGTIEFFSCDAAVRSITDEETVNRELLKIAGQYGRLLETSDGLDRERFRDLIFENREFRVKVEALLHPLVRSRLEECRSRLKDSAKIFLVEVPLLYEAHFPVSRSLDVVVGASPKTQERRLIQSRGLDLVLARKILNTQISIYEKVQRAHVVVWNDGDLDSFHSQIDHLALRCQTLCQ